MAKSRYEEYFLRQTGGSITQIYAGTPHVRGYGISGTYAGATHMRGHGVADFLRGIFRSVFPFVSSAGRAVAGEAARAGLHVLNDVTSGQAGFRDAVRRRVADAGEVLKEKLEKKASQLQAGSGYKYKHALVKPQLRRTVRTVNTKKKTGKALPKTLARDIFSKH